jgi:2'-5' RNA ligase
VFLSIELPEALRRRVALISERIVGLVPQAQNRLHLTVCFIGDVSTNELDRLLRIKKKIEVPEFDVELGKLTAIDLLHSRCWCIEVFPLGQMRVLNSLARKLLIGHGFGVEQVNYYPHITIGWPKAGEDTVEFDQSLVTKLCGVSFAVREVGIFESQSRDGSKVYEKRGGFGLLEDTQDKAIRKFDLGLDR